MANEEAAMQVVFSSLAESDLDAMSGYIAADNRSRALSFVEEIEQKCLGIGQFPYSYPVLRRYEASGFRRMVHRNYLIFFRVGPEAVEIVRILNGAMDYESILFPEVGHDS